MKDVPDELDVEHVLENTKHSVSSSDGWTLLNSKEHHRLLCVEESFAEMTAAKNKAVEALKRARNRISGDPTFGACPLGLDKLIKELEKVK